jgi:shikimate dehydrogenase
VIKYLDEVDGFAKKIGAVNVIKIKDGKRIGFNTDSDAFFETVDKWLPKDKDLKALILGTGGSSKAVQEALKKLNVGYKLVSREKKKGDLTYEDLEKNPSTIEESLLIINTTPLGMSPKRRRCLPSISNTLAPTITYTILSITLHAQCSFKRQRCAMQRSRTDWRCCNTSRKVVDDLE